MRPSEWDAFYEANGRPWGYQPSPWEIQADLMYAKYGCGPMSESEKLSDEFWLGHEADAGILISLEEIEMRMEGVL